MSKEIDRGFFEMKDVSAVLASSNLDNAKQYLSDKIDAFVLIHPTTRAENIAKALKMINVAKSKDKLALSVSDFILAHTSENLKVIR